MYTVESFSNSILGTSVSKVSQGIKKEDYKVFEIPKKNGSRKISFLPPDSQLADLQKKLLVNFLEKQILPVCVKGFKKGESYLTFLSPHVNSTFFLRIDIESFFPTISQSQVKEALSTLITCGSEDGKMEILHLISDIVTLNGSLPQGASTSPAVSNLVMSRIDQRILKYTVRFLTSVIQDMRMIYCSPVGHLIFITKSGFSRKLNIY